GNVFISECVFEFTQLAKGARPPGEAEKRLTRLVSWQGDRNVYTTNGPFLKLSLAKPWRDMPNPKLPGGLAGWKKVWTSAETGSVDGSVRFHGGNLLDRLQMDPEKVTPQDYRLRPDSAGYRAGKDGKDLGADVDLVGPGAAYERWKKTPEYQQWLKDSGQAK